MGDLKSESSTWIDKKQKKSAVCQLSPDVASQGGGGAFIESIINQRPRMHFRLAAAWRTLQGGPLKATVVQKPKRKTENKKQKEKKQTTRRTRQL